MSDVDYLLKDLDLGADARSFIDSPLGERLQKNAQEDINECLSHLKDMDADRGKDDLMRMKIASRMMVFEWLANAINAAEAANIQLEESESED